MRYMALPSKIDRIVMLNTVIIQPPIVQLNTPYPAGAYLASFFREQYRARSIPGTVTWFDMNIELFYELFSRQGLHRLFKESSDTALKLAERAERSGQSNTAFQLRRYVSEADEWCLWIGRITALACGNGTRISGIEYAHEFIRSAHVPRGMRMEQYFSNLGREPSADDARILASLALADLADYITTAFDGHFALIRYAESLAVSTSHFSDTEKGLDSPVLKSFYLPVLERKLAALDGPVFVGISIPFPGTFEAALFTARYIRRHYGDKALVVFGGGYVNTELRNVHERRLFDYTDIISYDRGFGSFCALFDAAQKTEAFTGGVAAFRAVLDGRRYYKLKYLCHGTIVVPLGMANNSQQEDPQNSVEIKKYMATEDAITRNLVPDFSGIDFSRYPRLADDANPMQRIWSDGAWIKAYLAYGCYWHRCAFCDTTLEYVYGYRMVEVKHLFDGLAEQAEKAGVYGIHFVDEALPPAALVQFAFLNCTARAEKTDFPGFTFWGNIRFEKSFMRDLADFLAYSGLTGVSAGIEIATGSGLSAVNKGTDMEHIVGACCAFKEAGILVHSYMIYGFWNQSAQDLIDSMETLRQLFAAGLIDSAFWHKFTLTRHSTVYYEWEQGKHPDLHPLSGATDTFAENDVRFEGEDASTRYTDGLTVALENWMHGTAFDRNVGSWFSFKVPEPSVGKDFVRDLITRYEIRRDQAFAELPGYRTGINKQYIWIGGKPFATGVEKNNLCWTYMGNLFTVKTTAGTVDCCVRALSAVRPDAQHFGSGNGSAAGSDLLKILGETLFTELRGKGLCCIS